jgi:hypothetical protein
VGSAQRGSVGGDEARQREQEQQWCCCGQKRGVMCVRFWWWFGREEGECCTVRQRQGGWDCQPGRLEGGGGLCAGMTRLTPSHVHMMLMPYKAECVLAGAQVCCAEYRIRLLLQICCTQTLLPSSRPLTLLHEAVNHPLEQVDG